MKEEDTHNDARFSDEMLQHLERSKDALQVPEGFFESQQIRLESALNNPFETPPGYFEEQAATLDKALHANSQEEQTSKIHCALRSGKLQSRWLEPGCVRAS